MNKLSIKNKEAITRDELIGLTDICFSSILQAIIYEINCKLVGCVFNEWSEHFYEVNIEQPEGISNEEIAKHYIEAGWPIVMTKSYETRLEIVLFREEKDFKEYGDISFILSEYSIFIKDSGTEPVKISSLKPGQMFKVDGRSFLAYKEPNNQSGVGYIGLHELPRVNDFFLSDKVSVYTATDYVEKISNTVKQKMTTIKVQFRNLEENDNFFFGGHIFKYIGERDIDKVNNNLSNNVICIDTAESTRNDDFDLEVEKITNFNDMDLWQLMPKKL